MANIPVIFNRDKVKKLRNRAASQMQKHDFLLREVAERMVSNLEAIRGDYENVLYLGWGSDVLAEHLKGQTSVKLFVTQDISQKMVEASEQTGVVADEEKMPYADQSFDLVIANLVLHTVNDLPGALIQIRKLLKKDGVFVASMFGTDTLNELRNVILDAETRVAGGSSPRVFPFSDVKTMGSLMQRAGFSEPVAHNDIIKVEYSNVLDLMKDVKGMGESNSLKKGGSPIAREVLYNMDSLYKEKFPDGDNGIISTFNIINITGLAVFGV